MLIFFTVSFLDKLRWDHKFFHEINPLFAEGFFMAGVAQLVRALGCGSRGRGFDPRRLPH